MGTLQGQLPPEGAKLFLAQIIGIQPARDLCTVAGRPVGATDGAMAPTMAPFKWDAALRSENY